MNSGKHIYAVLVLFFFVAINGFSQANDFETHRTEDGPVFQIIRNDRSGLTIIYSPGKPVLNEISTPEGIFYSVSLPGHSNSSDEGRPMLPVLNKLVDISNVSSINISISDVDKQRYFPSDFKVKGLLVPAQPSRSKNQEPQESPFVFNRQAYLSTAPLFSDTVTVNRVGVMRGRSLGLLSISPIIYYPSANYFDLITSLKIDISYKKTTVIPEVIKGNTPPPGTSQVLAKGLIDFDEEDVIPGFTLSPIGLVIISDTSMKDQLKPLVNWKTVKGFKVHELYVGENGLTRDFNDIKDTLDHIFENPPPGLQSPEYIIIAGDLNIIPYSEGTNQLSDMYYAEFDGEGDHIPDMFIGRLPARDTMEMRSIVSKIIEYEMFSFADTIDHYKKAVAVTGVDGGNATIMDGQVNYAANEYLNLSNKIEPYIFNHPYLPQQTTLQYDSLLSLMNDGVGFINYTGHGYSDEWISTNINYTTVDDLTNISRYPVIISNACLTAKYNEANCMGSAFVRARDKGALAFIGCSNDSYWDEDYYWAVGVSEFVEFPTYGDSGPGFYDKLFHTNGEAPSYWYASLGQIMFSGNLAVTMSSKPAYMKKYYWETYTLLGDPSLIPIIGEPDSINVHIPDTLPNILETLSFYSEPFLYASLSHFDTLWDASHITPSGSVNLTLPDITRDSCLVIITGQNKIPFIKTVYFSESDTAWLSINDINPFDPDENGNGIAEYSEKIALEIDLQNAGSQDATQVYAKLSSSSIYIDILEDLVNIGTVSALTTSVFNDLFEIQISDIIPDLEIISLDLEVHYGQTILNHSFDISIHSPVPDILDFYIDDTVSGNGNGLPDPDERLQIIIRLINNGSSPVSGILSLNNVSSMIAFDQSSFSTGILSPGELVLIPAWANISSEILSETLIDFEIDLDCQPYYDSQKVIFGSRIEDFELQNFSFFPWTNDSSYPWLITIDTSYNNSFSARSGLISDAKTSSLSIMLNLPVDDTISFWYKVSSEVDYDFLIFQLDDSIHLQESGEIYWTFIEIPVKKGVHRVEWRYKKDLNTFVGMDAAWIDMVSFPSLAFCSNDITLNKITSPEPGKQYNDEVIAVELSNFGRDTLRSFNMAYILDDGMPVEETFSEEVAPGDTVEVIFSQTVNLSDPGSYSIKAYVTSVDDYFFNDTLILEVISTAIGDIYLNDKLFKIGPNPFAESFIIFCENDFSDVNIELFSTTGNLIRSMRKKIILSGENIPFHNDALPSGNYLLRISTSGGIYVYRLIKR